MGALSSCIGGAELKSRGHTCGWRFPQRSKEIQPEPLYFCSRSDPLQRGFGTPARKPLIAKREKCHKKAFFVVMIMGECLLCYTKSVYKKIRPAFLTRRTEFSIIDHRQEVLPALLRIQRGTSSLHSSAISIADEVYLCQGGLYIFWVQTSRK